MSESKYRPPNLRTRPTTPKTLTIPPGHISFRLVCTDATAGGIIGTSGKIIKALCQQTSCNIHVQEPVPPPPYPDRVVHVIGLSRLSHHISLPDGTNHEVSYAQEGLLRVFERCLEVGGGESNGNGVINCSLLVSKCLVGNIMGKGGKRIINIEKQSGAFVKVYCHPCVPACALHSDELVKITGSCLAVKKALLLVSRQLQQKEIKIVREKGAPSAISLPSSLNMEVNDPVYENEPEAVIAEVVFRLLCSDKNVGAVIGHNGRRVMGLQDETAASIKCSAPLDGCNERVITISAFEDSESQYSSAQNAVLRVFSEYISSAGTETVTARLLIQPNQAGWLNIGGSSVIASIEEASGTKLHLLEVEKNDDSSDMSAGERIIQIDGEYSNVVMALLQILWRSRESYFHTLVAKIKAPLLPHKLFNMFRVLDESVSLSVEMNNCSLSDEVTDPLPHVCKSEFSNGDHLTTKMESPTNIPTTDAGPELSSEKNGTNMVTDMKVELVIHGKVFASLYSGNGENLDRLRQMSGAIVEVQDPTSGSEGKVIISGSPQQTLSAQSLLLAFMMAAN